MIGIGAEPVPRRGISGNR